MTNLCSLEARRQLTLFGVGRLVACDDDVTRRSRSDIWAAESSRHIHPDEAVTGPGIISSQPRKFDVLGARR